ncbi:hypothetical protein L226DRAFT_255279 [Lentinus tigrinus ALCF2SS1-7]|uniref:uncharacterized protein n=1 Tax=Lentinus tigrinus ALCF2SS1-7 TaxID=1328758 RepID=UPI001165FF31|nr:hypothetical protein L226DRAFT_255279 [Lentinus tigrinus ALCF2SS1-7]
MRGLPSGNQSDGFRRAHWPASGRVLDGLKGTSHFWTHFGPAERQPGRISDRTKGNLATWPRGFLSARSKVGQKLTFQTVRTAGDRQSHTVTYQSVGNVSHCQGDGTLSDGTKGRLVAEPFGRSERGPNVRRLWSILSGTKYVGEAARWETA